MIKGMKPSVRQKFMWSDINLKKAVRPLSGEPTPRVRLRMAWSDIRLKTAVRPI